MISPIDEVLDPNVITVPTTWLPSRPVQVPTNIVPPIVGPIIMQNNVDLAPAPSNLPPSPQITQTLVGTPTGFQFSFNQVTLPRGATNEIVAYRIYRNTQNVFAPHLVHVFVHDPRHFGAIVFTDTIVAADGLNYYYWVTSVDSTGLESTPQTAQASAIDGSIGSTPFSTTGSFAYTSTPTSITWYWDGTNGSSTITIYRADNTTTGPLSGSQAVTGLSPSTTYNFYPYYNEVTKAIEWVAGGSGTPDYAQASAGSKTLIQAQNLRTRIPLSISGMPGTTPASGSGGGTGGGGGGGGGCFTGNVRIKTPDGFVRFDELPNEFEVENQTGVHKATLCVHAQYLDNMVDMGNGELVTFGHHFKYKRVWAPAWQVLHRLPQIYEWRGTVYNLHVESEKEEDHHYILENGMIAHNLSKF